MKILILLISGFLITGCYDYKELDQLSLISAIGIDFIDNQYMVTLEVINTNISPQDEASYEDKSVTYIGNGDTFYLAYESALRKLDQIPYLYQTQLLIISEEVAQKDFANILDLMLRENRLNNAFYTVMAHELSANELLEKKTPDEPIVSASIISFIVNISGTEYERFDTLVNQFLSKGIDLSILGVSYEEDELSIKNMGLFDEEKFVTFLSDEHTEILNILHYGFTSLPMEIDGDAVILNDIENSIEYNNGVIEVNLKAGATIKELNERENLREDTIYDELSNKFTNFIQKDIIDLVNTLRDYHIDPLGFGHLVYLEDSDLYTEEIGHEISYKVNVDITVNKNGFIFEVIR